MTARVLVRVDASASIGAGHLARSARLASALMEHGAEVSLVTRGVPHAVAHLVPAGASVRPVEDDSQPVLALARELPGTIVVVDGYHFPPDLCTQLQSTGAFVVAIEDRLDVDPPVDVLIDANLYADHRRVSVRAAHALLGPSYALLRPEFRSARRDVARALDPVTRVLVTLGGADPARVGPRLVEALAALDASPLDAIVIAPPTDPDPTLRAVREVVSKHRFEAFAGVRDMASRIAASDLVVTAAGSTVLELACIGVPAVALTVADNQVPVAQEAVARGMVLGAGDARAFDARRLVDAILALTNDPTRRTTMVRAQQAAVDGLGAHRAAAAILNHHASFLRAADRGTRVEHE